MRDFMGMEYETSPDVPDSIYDEVERIILKDSIHYMDSAIAIFKMSPEHANAITDIYGGLATYSDFVNTRKEAEKYLKELEEK